MLTDPDIAILLTGSLVGISAALIGPFLILRQTAMLSDAISHAIVLGIMLTWLSTGLTSGPIQILGAGLSGLLCVWLIERLTETRRVKEDAAIGLVFPALFAAGVLLMNLFARDVHVGVHTVLFGEISFVWLDTTMVLGVEVPNALLWMGVIALVNLGFVLALWKELKLTTFDPVLAAAFGVYPRAIFYALLLLTSITAVAAFDAVGAILFIAFVIVPPSAAYLLTDRLGLMVFLGVVIAVASVVSGHALAMSWDVSISGMMALMTGVGLASAVFTGPRYGLLWRLLRRRAERQRIDVRTLMVHLHAHEASLERGQENVADALVTHLNWPEVRANSVLEAALAKGLIRHRDNLLVLTELGREEARALVEPWRR